VSLRCSYRIAAEPILTAAVLTSADWGTEAAMKELRH